MKESKTLLKYSFIHSMIYNFISLKRAGANFSTKSNLYFYELIQKMTYLNITKSLLAGHIISADINLSQYILIFDSNFRKKPKKHQAKATVSFSWELHKSDLSLVILNNSPKMTLKYSYQWFLILPEKISPNNSWILKEINCIQANMLTGFYMID